jgi:hypothetical protein
VKAFTLMVSLQESGRLSLTVAKRNMVTRHYVFFQSPERLVAEPANARLRHLVHMAMVMIQEDAELRDL